MDKMLIVRGREVIIRPCRPDGIGGDEHKGSFNRPYIDDKGNRYWPHNDGKTLFMDENRHLWPTKEQ